jgi:hypothetical protein
VSAMSIAIVVVVPAGTASITIERKPARFGIM